MFETSIFNREHFGVNTNTYRDMWIFRCGTKAAVQNCDDSWYDNQLFFYLEPSTNCLNQ